MRTLNLLALAVAAVWVFAFVIAWASPVAYLKIQSQIGITPISISWALQRANEDLISGAYEVCKQPVLFAWYSSFSGGPVLPEELTVPVSAEFEEVVLFSSGIVRESTHTALEKMAVFNEITHSRCLAEAES
jgi:hypothetical protein